MIKTTTSKQLYEYGNQKIEYTLVRSKRRKTSELIVDEDEVTLRIPFNKSINDAKKLIASKIKWIIRKQMEYRQRKPEILKPNFSHGSTVPYLGKNYKVKIMNNGNEEDKIELKKDQFIVTLTLKKNRPDDDNRIKSLYEDWLYHEAVNIFGEKIKRFHNIIDVGPKKIVVKKLKNRWGSVTKKGTINLNYNLVKAPDDIVDYIIIHELCHLLIKKHSHHYWNLLKGYVRDYEKKIKWLEINGKNLVG
jgi:predicted metal-dependent hydrolase